jgi:hypothetical protein
LYIIRCFNPEIYTSIEKSIPENISISIFNSNHKEYVEYLDVILKENDVVLEYPRGLEIEVAWIVGKVNKRYLQKLRVEIMDTLYQPKSVNEILVIGGGYNEQQTRIK